VVIEVKESRKIMPDKYTKEAEKLLPKKMKVHIGFEKYKEVIADVGGYNFAREEDIPIVAKLLKQIDELKNIVEAYEDRE